MHETLEKLRRELNDAITGLSAEETQVRREAGKWNVQQIVEHLLLSYKTTQEVVLARVAKGTPTKAKPMLTQRLAKFWITRLGLFPPGRRAPEIVSPREVPKCCLSGDQLAAELARALNSVDAALMEAETAFGSQQAISHLVLGPMSAAQWRRFHLVHGEHHVKQIKATRSTAKATT